MSRWTIEGLRTLAVERERNELTFPQIQAKHFPSKSVSAVRSATRTKKYKEVASDVEQGKGVVTAGEPVQSFRFPGIGLTLDADTFASIVRSYVDAGAGNTRSQVARAHGITEAQMDHICRVYGLTKDSPPVPLEILAQVEDEEVVEATLHARAEGVKDSARRSRSGYFERKYRKLEKELQTREAVLQRLDRWLAKRDYAFGARPIEKDVESADPCQPRIVHIPTADLHLGKQAWEPEVGSNYDIHIGADRLRNHGEWAREIIRDNGGVEIAFVTEIGDFFHAILSQTESGTSLDKDTRDLKVFDLALEAKIAQIDAIREVSDHVIVMGVPGNHDHIFVPLFHRMLKLHYRNVSDVTVHDVYGRYAGFVVGSTAHLLDHGTGVGSLTGWKAKAQLHTVEKHALDSKSRENVHHRVYYTGHKHSLQVESFTEMELRRLPQLGEPDDYEVSLRYSATPGAELYFLSESGRIDRIHRFYPS